MTIYAHKLKTIDISTAPVYVNPPGRVISVTLQDPATSVMTDLMHVRAITVDSDQSITFAADLMKHVGVRMLVVIDHGGLLGGLMTARDILGEKPINIMNSERINRDEIKVHQIMTPVTQLNPLDFADVEHATVKDVIIKLRDVGRQHAIVIESRDQADSYTLRGIFSITQIGRQLGMNISDDGHVQSFAEFEQLIA